MFGLAKWMVLGSAALLAACASTVTSDVTTFGRIGAPQGSTIQVIAKDPAKEGTLEFRTYAQMIGERLGALGYRPTPKGEKPELEVRVDYAVDEGKVHVRSDPDFGYGFGYLRYSARYPYHPYYDPFYPGFALDRDIESYVVYDRSLSVDIVRAADSSSVFEGRAVSQGRNRHLNEVLPYMIEALFQKLPGDNGKTSRIRVKIPNE